MCVTKMEYNIVQRKALRLLYQYVSQLFFDMHLIGVYGYTNSVDYFKSI